MNESINNIMSIAPVIPVLVIDDISIAAPLAKVLVDAGLPAIEITLRTPNAIEIIKEMKQVDGAVLGAGTVTNPADLDSALTAGSEFIVSPGLTLKLGEEAVKAQVPFLPGVACPSDIMLGLELGLQHFKFFPANSLGTTALESLAGPFGQCKFSPSGGISLSNASLWLALENVLCVGGTWIVPKTGISLDSVKRAATQAAELASRSSYTA